MYSEGTIRYVASEFAKGDCIVAFLDILGFEDLVKNYVNPKSTQDKKIKETIQSALKEALKNIETGDNKELNLIKYRIFSDCTCLSTPQFHHTELEATSSCLLITMIKGFTFKLMDKKIYLRGGLSLGYHYEDDYMIFSDGLIKAHHLENKKAIYPRTIIDEELVRRFKRLWKDHKETVLFYGTEKVIITDEKGIAFINPFNLGQSSMKETKEAHSKKELRKLDKIYNKRIQRDINENIIKFKVVLNNLRKSFDNKKACEDYLLKADCNFNKEISRNDKDKIKEYLMNKRVLDKYEWLNELIKWNIKPKSSKYKFEYLLK